MGVEGGSDYISFSQMSECETVNRRVTNINNIAAKSRRNHGMCASGCDSLHVVRCRGLGMMQYIASSPVKDP